MSGEAIQFSRLLRYARNDLKYGVSLLNRREEKFLFPGLLVPLRRWRVGLVVFAFLLNGCAYPISENLRREADPVVFSQLFQHPEPYAGKKVILGGTIVKVVNFPDKAEIEVVQKELDSYGAPQRGDVTGGRFIFVKPGYVESEVYAKGREVTGAGKVLGSKLGKLEDRDYRYPLIEVEELHLWEKRDRLYPMYPFLGYPYYPYSGWRDPFYW